MIDFSTVAAEMKGREMEFLHGYLTSEQLSGKNQPCPFCSGTDRYRLYDKKDGSFFCNSYDRKIGDVFSHVAHTQGMTMKQVREEAIVFLGLENPSPQLKREQAARRERILAASKKKQQLKHDRAYLLSLVEDLRFEISKGGEVLTDEILAASDLSKMIRRVYRPYHEKQKVEVAA